MSNDILRIGTRDSELATWQATTVSGELNKLGFKTEIIFIKSDGDLDLTTPLLKWAEKEFSLKLWTTPFCKTRSTWPYTPTKICPRKIRSHCEFLPFWSGKIPGTPSSLPKAQAFWRTTMQPPR